MPLSPRHHKERDRTETQFLDYTTQQRKLLGLVATAYAYHFASAEMVDLYNKLQVGGGRRSLFQADVG